MLAAAMQCTRDKATAAAAAAAVSEFLRQQYIGGRRLGTGKSDVKPQKSANKIRRLGAGAESHLSARFPPTRNKSNTARPGWRDQTKADAN